MLSGGISLHNGLTPRQNIMADNHRDNWIRKLQYLYLSPLVGSWLQAYYKNGLKCLSCTFNDYVSVYEKLNTCSQLSICPLITDSISLSPDINDRVNISPFFRTGRRSTRGLSRPTPAPACSLLLVLWKLRGKNLWRKLLRRVGLGPESNNRGRVAGESNFLLSIEKLYQFYGQWIKASRTRLFLSQ